MKIPKTIDFPGEESAETASPRIPLTHGLFSLVDPYLTATVDTAEQAARDRDALAFRLHGPFAVLNFKAA